jgi:hypothetical protein
MGLAEAVLSDLLGEESIEGHEAQTVEELLRHAAENVHESHADNRRARTGRGRRGHAADEERSKAQAERKATQSVREIYRKLASALHPDRETNASEHRRKTALMQRTNQAYAQNDLLQLLALQIEIEQIDAAALADLPEARLRHYNEVLNEQLQVLESQLQAQTVPFHLQFGLAEREIVPQRVDQALSANIAEARAMIDRIERTSKRLHDPALRGSAIDELPEPDDDLDPLDLALAAAFEDQLNRARHSRRRKR